MTQVNFRVEDDVKVKAEKALKDMGLSMSTAINIFLVKVGREKRIPFEINADPFYSDEHISMLERRAADMKARKNSHEHKLLEVDE